MSGSAIVLAPAALPDIMPTMSSMCIHCGNHLPSPDEAHRRIQDLEAQVRLLNTKAAAAVDKIADYEDDMRSLRKAYTELQEQQQQQRSQSLSQPQTQTQSPPTTSQSLPLAPPLPIDTSTPSPILTPTTAPAQTNPASPPRPTTSSRLASLSSFFPGRKRDTSTFFGPATNPPSTPSTAVFFGPAITASPEHHNNSAPISNSRTPTPLPPSIDNNSNTDIATLHRTLENERTLRLRAESSLSQTQSELEDLTATLFGQANEMVATERKARAKLEERVKVLEDRDGEKRKRLERLENAMGRIERVRGMVGTRNGSDDDKRAQSGLGKVNGDRESASTMRPQEP